MEDADQEEVYFETLENEFNVVKAETNTYVESSTLIVHLFVDEAVHCFQLQSP